MTTAVLAALGAALCFAASSVLQQRAAQRAPTEKALRIALLVDLLHRRSWLVGFSAAAAGFGLQGLALHYGCLALVQPIILVDLPLALPVAARLRGQPFRPVQLISGVLVVASVGLLLAAGSPHGGQPGGDRPRFAVLMCALAGAALTCGSIARLTGRRTRTILLAAGAGLLFGLLAALLDIVTYLLAHRGMVGTLSTWEPYLLALVAPAGEVFAQSAYQAGPLSASLPTLNTVEPCSAIAIGVVAFGEHIAHTQAAIILQALAALGIVAGIVALGRDAADATRNGDDLAQSGSPSDTPSRKDVTGAAIAR